MVLYIRINGCFSQSFRSITKGKEGKKEKTRNIRLTRGSNPSRALKSIYPTVTILRTVTMSYTFALYRRYNAYMNIFRPLNLNSFLIYFFFQRTNSMFYARFLQSYNFVGTYDLNFALSSQVIWLSNNQK